MDELDISGKRYISSKRAAKENRYHVDYIGQLIRAGKIFGSKVGRTWYVEVESLENYLGQEHQLPSAVVVSNHIPKASVPLKDISPALEIPQKPTPVTPAKAPTEPMYRDLPRDFTSRLTYLADDESPVQQINKSERKIEITKREQSSRLESTHQTDYAPVVARTASHDKKSTKLPLYAIAIVGVLVFLGVLSASCYLKADTIVGAENSQYSVHL